MMAIARRFFAQDLLIAFALGLAAAGWSAPARAANPEDSWRLCADQISRAERVHRLPAHLLAAIAKVESGRWRAESGANPAWPWTVTTEGRGRYLATKAAAIAEVRALRARGVRNVDVGCMQINLTHHAGAFGSLEAAFDPARNVAYAARFLLDLRAKWGSWTRAIGNYHSNTPRLSGPYRAKVFRARFAERRRVARLAALDARRRASAATRPDPAPIHAPAAVPVGR